jgi:hypothetical protein
LLVNVQINIARNRHIRYPWEKLEIEGSGGISSYGKTMNQIEYSIKGAFRIAQTVRAITQTGLDWALGDRPPAPT